MAEDVKAASFVYVRVAEFQWKHFRCAFHACRNKHLFSKWQGEILVSPPKREQANWTLASHRIDAVLIKSNLKFSPSPLSQSAFCRGAVMQDKMRITDRW